MAITKPAIDISRETPGLIPLPAEISTEIWQDAREASVIQRLGSRISLPAGGKKIPIITGDSEAEWVGETNEKPVGDASFDFKTITPYKAALIELFSDEFRRDYNSLYAALQERLPTALGALFDKAALGFAASPGTGFDTLAGSPSVTLNGYDDYLDVLEKVSDAKGKTTGWAFSDKAEINALRHVDKNGRPILIDKINTEGSVGSILARPVYKSQNVQSGDVIGVAGDWNTAYWGVVEDISLSINTDGSVRKNGEDYHLWQRNMFAVRVEFEVGFAVRDDQRFVKLKAGSATPGS
jgi:HK97 family phage major capsid protein